MSESELLTPGSGQGGGQLPPITDPYVTVSGDTLPSIAERAGYSGEWQALALANIDKVTDAQLDDAAKVAVVAERSQRVGVELTMPAVWNIAAAGQQPAQDQEAAPAGSAPGEVVEALEEMAERRGARHGRARDQEE